MKGESFEVITVLAVEVKEIEGFDFGFELKVSKVFPKSVRKIPREKKVSGSIWVKLIVFSKTIKKVLSSVNKS